MQLSTIVNNRTALTMSSREIAELTGKEHKNVLADIRKMLQDLELTSAVFSANLPDAYGRQQQIFNLNKELTLTLVAGYNVKLRLAIIKRWQELEEKEKLMSKLDTTAEQDIRILSAVSDMLRLSDSGRIGMVRKYIENETPKLKAYLPAYAIDAPTDSTVVGNSSQVTKCATDLLMIHNSKVTTRKFNEMLVEKGFLETQMRPSANKVMKPFKCITEKGLKYGKNLTSDKNQKETQPHWYVNKFPELLNELGL